MKAKFTEDGASLSLGPREYGFLFNCLSDRVETLPQWEIEPRLGMSYDDARSIIDALLTAELEARGSGDHWMPPKRERPLDGELSRAVVVWTGFGLTKTPSRSGDRVIEEFGCDAALDLLPRVTALEDSFYMSDARFTAPDLESMGVVASVEFQEIHPEISASAVQALAWCYTHDYK